MRGKKRRIEKLTRYLEEINMGKQGILVDTTDDEFSHLRDEIYKTVTALYQTRDEAIKAKENYADNLANIAHQLKTPITALLLSVQMMRENPSSDNLAQIERSAGRLQAMEEALLLLSRLDSGTLCLKQEKVDVFTLLTLAFDNLQELFRAGEVQAEVLEAGEVSITADLDWTMEAVMNLVKNCMEHTPRGGCVHCSYEENPLYVQIRIWDEGAGFAEADVFHLFDRFYRGEGEKSGGIGIGLSLAKEIIDMQRGNVSAFNLPSGGGCFEIRFYRH